MLPRPSLRKHQGCCGGKSYGPQSQCRFLKPLLCFDPPAVLLSGPRLAFSCCGSGVAS
jgi:hypothetical protein